MQAFLQTAVINTKRITANRTSMTLDSLLGHSSNELLIVPVKARWTGLIPSPNYLPGTSLVVPGSAASPITASDPQVSTPFVSQRAATSGPRASSFRPSDKSSSEAVTWASAVRQQDVLGVLVACERWDMQSFDQVSRINV